MYANGVADSFQMIRLLDLKQKQINLWEARISREGAEEAAKQGHVCVGSQN
jgi:hypothetical protein